MRFSFGLSKGNEPVNKWIIPDQVKEDKETVSVDDDKNIGEKRKAEDIIPNIFKKIKSDTDCQNGNIKGKKS